VLIVVSWFNVVVILIMDDLNFLERDQYFLGCDRQCAMFRKLDLPESSSLFFFNPTASIRVPFFWSFRIDKETICSMQYAVCSMQYAVCSMQYAVCSMQYELVRTIEPFLSGFPTEFHHIFETSAPFARCTYQRIGS
jgi:hypothetical protein